MIYLNLKKQMLYFKYLICLNNNNHFNNSNNNSNSNNNNNNNNNNSSKFLFLCNKIAILYLIQPKQIINKWKS